jgi:hypothetical protein
MKIIEFDLIFSLSFVSIQTIDAINNKVTLPVNTQIDIQVLDNDILSPDGSPLDITYIVFRGTHGECTITNEGKTITYSPNTDFYGTDTCIYTACDEKRRCDSAAVIITVTPVIASDDSVITDINTPVDIFPIENDIFTDGHPLTVVLIEENAKNGDCVIVSQQIVIYIPNPDFHGTDGCQYQACDDRGVCDSAVINITVDGTPCDKKDNRTITSSPSSSSPSSQPIRSPPTTHDETIPPSKQPVLALTSNHPTQHLTAEPVFPTPIVSPTYRPTANPLTPAPAQTPTTASPTMSPTRCNPRSFFFSRGVCTNALDEKNESEYG